MKRVLLTCITLLYLTVSTGFSLEVHYCMGQLERISWVSHKAQEDCGRCGMPEQNGGCCHNESKFVKFEYEGKGVTCLPADQAVVTDDIQVFAFNHLVHHTGAVPAPSLPQPPLRYHHSRSVWFGVFRL